MCCQIFFSKFFFQCFTTFSQISGNYFISFSTSHFDDLIGGYFSLNFFFSALAFSSLGSQIYSNCFFAMSHFGGYFLQIFTRSTFGQIFAVFVVCDLVDGFEYIFSNGLPPLAKSFSSFPHAIELVTENGDQFDCFVGFYHHCQQSSRNFGWWC